MLIDELVAVIKEVKPITFLYFRAEAYVSQLSNFLPVSKELFKEAVNHNLQITGPIHWHYFGFTGNEKVPFTLEVALPVSDVIPEYDGSFHFKRSELFKCVSLIHEGSWEEIPRSYGRLARFIAEKKLQPTAVNREVYVNSDFDHPEANVTEIQVGIK